MLLSVYPNTTTEYVNQQTDQENNVDGCKHCFFVALLEIDQRY